MGISLLLGALVLLICIALAVCWAALARTRARERQLLAQADMQAARLESAERTAGSLSERLWASKRELDAERSRVRQRIDKLERQAGEVRRRDSIIDTLEAELRVLRERESARLAQVRKALEAERSRVAKLEKERLWLVRGFEGLMRRKRAELDGLRSRLAGGGPAVTAGGAPATPARRDDLQRIDGIGPVLERSLNELGITSYRQLAELGQHDRERLSGALRARVDCEDWAAAARLEHERKYGQSLAGAVQGGRG